MKLHGQRWRYRVGNAEVCVDNAFSWWGWAQERWLINDEVVRVTGGWFSFRRSFSEPWLTPLGDGMLAADLRSSTGAVTCAVTLDGQPIAHDALFETSWHGRDRWPPEEAWEEVERFAIFAGWPQG